MVAVFSYHNIIKGIAGIAKDQHGNNKCAQARCIMIYNAFTGSYLLLLLMASSLQLTRVPNLGTYMIHPSLVFYDL